MSDKACLQLTAAIDKAVGCPKLLIKISKNYEVYGVFKHLGEITINCVKKESEHRPAILAMYSSVPDGIVIISDKLADSIGIQSGEKVEIQTQSCGLSAPDTRPGSAASGVTTYSPTISSTHSDKLGSNQTDCKENTPNLTSNQMVSSDSSSSRNSLGRGTELLLGSLLLDPVDLMGDLEVGEDFLPQLLPILRRLLPVSCQPEDFEATEFGAGALSHTCSYLRGNLTGSQLAAELTDLKLSRPQAKKTDPAGGPLATLVGGRQPWAASETLRKAFSGKREDVLIRAVRRFSTPNYSLQDASYFSDAVNSCYRRGQIGSVEDGSACIEIIRAAAALLSGRTGPRRGDSDCAVLRELELLEDATALAAENDTVAVKDLEALNSTMDEYLLRLMRFKTAAVDHVSSLQELAAYAILGLSPGATDAELKRAYRAMAMHLHPDKGGDKALFQELTEAYDKILELRKLKQPQAQDKQPNDEESKASPAASEPSSPKEVVNEEERRTTVHSAAADAVKYAQSAAEFASQALEASQSASAATLETIAANLAHSAVVLALTAVKAMKIVGYSTLDAASHALKLKCHDAVSTQCAAAADAGFLALSAASACASDVERASAELRSSRGPGLAVLGAVARRVALSAGEAARVALDAARKAEEVVFSIDSQPHEGSTPAQDSAKKSRTRRELAAEQRRENGELLRRLNAELVSYQQQVAEVLTGKMLAGPSAISIDEKEGVFKLVRDYLVQSYRCLLPSPPRTADACIAAMAALPDWAGLLGPRRLAVPLSVAARSFRLALFTDRSLLRRLLSATLLDPLTAALGLDAGAARSYSEAVRERLLAAAAN